MSEQQRTEIKTDDRRMVDVVIASRRFGNKSNPSLQTVRVPISDNDTIRLDLTIDVRSADTIEIRPVRRELSDIDGLIGDAIRLANS